MVELLAPAGDLQRLKVAIIYGADAVYFGGKQFSLRARASNFTIDDIASAVTFAHGYGRKVYVTVNVIPHNSDFEGLKEYLMILEELGVDAIICASAAIAAICRQYAGKMEIHISTQQTTLNSWAIAYWKENGADRIVLGREVTYEQLCDIMPVSPLPIEVFIHGGMCANYSGRCTISNVLTNRDANRGGCAQSCRWNYHLWHEDQLLDREDYLLSMGSKDMCAGEYIERLLELGVASMKIEGRMKTAYYIACIVKGYRLLIDSWYENGRIDDKTIQLADYYFDLAANRETFPGFYGGLPFAEGQLYNLPTTASQNFIGNVIEYLPLQKKAVIEVRNNFRVHDRLLIMRPEGEDVEFEVEELIDEEGNKVEVANRPMQHLTVSVPVEVDTYCFIHKAGD